MGKIDSIIPTKQLDIDYTAAKIIASPYDYKISDRILFYRSDECQAKFNIFEKNGHSEEVLATMLCLKYNNYMLPYVNLKINITEPTIALNKSSVQEAEVNKGYVGTMIKWNNLIINDSEMYMLLRKYVTGFPSKAKSIYLKALEVWYLKATSASSLIPNLMYLTTRFYAYSLNDIENIKFAEEAIEKGEAPLMPGFRQPDKDPMDLDMVFNAAITAKAWNCSPNVPDHFIHMGIAYAFVYGAELLYHFYDLQDCAEKDILKELLSFGYTEDTFCSKYLYQIDGAGEVIINPGLLACFSNNNEDRFNSIRLLFDTMVSTEFACLSSKAFYQLPEVFDAMIVNMHIYAYQVARIKHATLLYKKAKDAGVLNKEDFTASVDSGGIIGGIGLGTDDDEDASEGLIDLSTFETKGESSLSAEESIEKEKEVHKKKRERTSALNAADMLKKDLHDSKYDFDVHYVKHSVTDKDAYNAIAKNIKMITNELTKQIKEIKTYNTGGKQSGLLNGKLDKKNLWKYKTDPHIFYNNNYKLKEMDLAFGCILDESGSMYGEKIKNGRIVMIMLHEVLNSLGINHSIIGHTSNGMYQTKIFKYFQFKEEAHYSLDKPYGIVRADNRSGNCDSGSLYYMQSVMKGVRNKDKIVIIFSDGQPTECTDLDLTEQVKTMEKSGIHVIGVGINFESIKEYYPDNANGKNLSEMVKIVVSILKRYVLEKKED